MLDLSRHPVVLCASSALYDQATMFSSLEFCRFKALNLPRVIRMMEIEDRENIAKGGKPVAQAQRLAKIHLKLRNMYLASSTEEMSTHSDQSTSLQQGYGASSLTFTIADHWGYSIHGRDQDLPEIAVCDIIQRTQHMSLAWQSGKV